jgi:TonB family protein
VERKPKVLVIAVVLLLSVVVHPQGTPDSQKAASAEPHILKGVHREAPVYPPEAKAKKISGMVIVEAVVDKEGNVISTRIIEGDKIFWQSALTAIKAWKFEPLTSQRQEKTTIKIGFAP